jgi:hypothetical protein
MVVGPPLLDHWDWDRLGSAPTPCLGCTVSVRPTHVSAASAEPMSVVYWEFREACIVFDVVLLGGVIVVAIGSPGVRGDRSPWWCSVSGVLGFSVRKSVI